MDPQKILIVNMNYLGDALMTTPAIHALRLRFPSTQLDVVAGCSQSYGAYEVLAHNPDIDHLIARVDAGAFRRTLQLLVLLIKGRYDTALVLPSIPIYMFMVRLACVKRQWLLPRLVQRKHMAQHFLDELKVFVPDLPSSPSMLMRYSKDADDKAANALADLQKFTRAVVGINVGGSRPQKRWPSEHLSALARELIEQGYGVVLLGGPDDAAVANDISGDVPRLESGQAHVRNMAGKTDLQTLAAVVAHCDVLVTGDTGAMHIASALSTPFVALFGSTDPLICGPFGVGARSVVYKELVCSPCGSHPTCGGKFMCLNEITSGEVALAVKNLLRMKRGVQVATVTG